MYLLTLIYSQISCLIAFMYISEQLNKLCSNLLSWKISSYNFYFLVRLYLIIFVKSILSNDSFY